MMTDDLTTHPRVADAQTQLPEAPLAARLEALLFLVDEPTPATVLSVALDADEDEVEAAAQSLEASYLEQGRGLAVRRTAGGWRMYTSDTVRPTVERHVLMGRSGRLTQAALETLAVVAYKQPITRADVSDIRGVNADGAIRSLVARGLVEDVGRQDAPGSPVLYATTVLLLERLGLQSLMELPPLQDFLPSEAPDEPALGDLARARRLLAEGGELPTTGRGRWDPDDPALPAPLPRARSAELDDEMDDVTHRLEAAATSAMARLKQAVAATDVALADGDDPVEPEDDEPVGTQRHDPVEPDGTEELA